jgi:parvulin-like peptidyl-prolyl isomerase
MAILSKIREKSLALIAIIGLALFAFVLDPSTLSDFFSSSKVNEIGKVNGETISREQFATALEAYKRQTQNSVSEMQASKTVWENLVKKLIYTNQLDEAGITVGEEDVWAEVINQPSVKDNAQFQNEAGLFDEEKFKQFLANTKETNADLWASWNNYLNQIKENAETLTYNNLITAGLGASLKEGEIQYKNENTKLSSQFIYMPYTTVADSLVTISKNEINDYVKSHKKDFKVDASRDISYVKFEIIATLEDELEIKNELAALLNDKQEYSNVTKGEIAIQGLKNTENYTLFFDENNSDLPLDTNYKYRNDVSSEIADDVFKGEKGAVFGPYKENGFFNISKITEVASLPDSVKARHILIPFIGSRSATQDITQTEEQAKKTADSLVVVLNRRSSKFEALAKEFSADKSNADKGGDLDRFDYNRMVPEFRDFAFTNRKGTIGVAKTDFGFHIIEIQDQINFQTVVKLVTFGKTIIASEGTENTVFQDSEKFALEVSKNNEFFNVATDKKYNTTPAIGLKILDENVPGLGNQRQVVQWTFDKETKVGDFKRFDLDNGYIVASLTGKNDDGFMSATMATGSVRPLLINEKKAEIIKQKLLGTTLAELAKSGNTTVRNASDVNLKTPTISGVGSEPIVVGAMSHAKENELYKGIEGAKGVFAFVVTKRELPTVLPNYEPIRNQIAQARKRQSNNIYEAIKKSSEIEDNRASFYGIN